MAKQYVITEEEMMSLIESLELVKMRQEANHVPNAAIHKQDIDAVHRSFHFVTVRWAQSIGFSGWRK